VVVVVMVRRMRVQAVVVGGEGGSSDGGVKYLEREGLDRGLDKGLDRGLDKGLDRGLCTSNVRGFLYRYGCSCDPTNKSARREEAKGKGGG
jgi:hypothetical protein